jgi:hypothetical protein
MARHGRSRDAAATWPRRAMRGSFVDRYLASSQDDGRLLSSLAAAVPDADATLLGMAASANRCCDSNSCCQSASCCASGSYCPGGIENELDRRLNQVRPKGPRLWPAPLG